MEQKQQYPIPDFMRDFYNGSNDEGKAKLQKHANKYELERQHFMQTVYPEKKRFERDWNETMNKNENLTPEQATKPMRDAYQQSAEKLAAAHGYVPKPEAPSATEREKFLAGLRAGRERPVQQKADQAAKPSANAKPQTPRDAFMQTLKTNREQIVQRKPRIG